MSSYAERLLELIRERDSGKRPNPLWQYNLVIWDMATSIIANQYTVTIKEVSC